jgi:hypothetical protein
MISYVKFMINRYLSILFLGLVTFIAGCGSFGVPTPRGWSDSLQVRETLVTEERTVSDIESRTTLFTYHMYPTSQPLMVRKVEGERWIAVFEKPGEKADSEVTIERISDSEYRVLVKSVPE